MKSDFKIENPPKLRDCPFCGNKAYITGLFIVENHEEINTYKVGCENCGVHFNQNWNYDFIVDLWNGEYYKDDGLPDE